MTIIEFFDRESAVENIAGALLNSPEKVIFIGDSTKRMEKSIENYSLIAADRGLNTEFLFKGVSRNNLKSIIAVLEEVVSENKDCIIDIAGGEDLFLVAVGAVSQKYGDRIKLQRFNISNNSITKCDEDGCLKLFAPLELSVDEDIRIYCGRVIYDNEKANATYSWVFDDEFRKDVRSMWSVCKNNASLWNAQINTISALSSIFFNKETLSLSVDFNDARRIFAERKSRFVFEKNIFYSLQKADVIRNLKIDDNRFAFSFKNSQVMKCLTKAGQILELIITVTAIELKDADGTSLYNDAKSGVYIDWDGVVQADSRIDVENEMDVILMKGMVPVFISCKNGALDSDELYKLSVVAERFGGKFVKKVLVTSELDEMGYRAEYIRARAKDMGIRLVEDVDVMSDEKLNKTVASLWK